MALDPVVNFFRSTIATLPLNSGTTTMVLASGDGNKLPDPSVDGAFNLVVYDPSDPFVAPEIVRCTARTSDTLTISRGQEGTSDATKAAGIAWTVELVPTAKTIQDIDSTKVNVADIVNNLTSTDTNKPLSANQGKVLQDGKVAKAGDTMTGTLTATKLIPSGNVTAGNGMYLPATNTVAFSTNGAERVRVNASGNVGIGTSSPASKAVVAGSSTAEMLRIVNTTPDSTTPFAGVLFNHRQQDSDQTTTTAAFGRGGRIVSGREGVYGGEIVNHNSNLQFFTSLEGVDTERLRITSAGDVGIGTTSPASKLHVNGLTRSTSGINFNASGGSTLSSYEEGTWTPTVIGVTTSGTASYAVQVAQYTKIGNTVYATCFVTWSGHTGTGEIQISGLPFTATGDVVSQIPTGAGYAADFNFGANATQIVPFVFGGLSVISWRGVINNNTRLIPNVSASGSLGASVVYRTT